MECQANDIRFFLLPRIRKKRRFKIPPLPVSKDVFAAVRRYFRPVSYTHLTLPTTERV